MGPALAWTTVLPHWVHPAETYSFALLLMLASCLTLLLFLGRSSWNSAPAITCSDLDPVQKKQPTRLTTLTTSLLVLPLLCLSFGLLLKVIVATAARPRLAEEGLFEWLFVNTTGTGSAHGAVWLWLLAIVLSGAATLLIDWVRGSRPHLVGTRAEWLFVALASAAILAYLAHDLNHWRFSVVGDEYRFLTYAEYVKETDALPVFSERGVYGTHPILGSAYQALFLKLLGTTAFAWKLSSVVASVATLIPLFVLMRLLFSFRAAAVTVVLYGFSHYNYAFAHIGYNNNHIHFPVCAAIAAIVWARRSGNLTLGFLAGCFAGLGCFTFFSARLAVVAVALCFLVLAPCGDRRQWRRYGVQILVAILGFVVTAAPIVRNPTDSLKLASAQTAVSQDNGDHSVVSRTVHRNLVHSALMPLTFNALTASSNHFVRGGIVDRATSVLVIWGLAILLLNVRHGPERLLLLLYTVLVLALAVTSNSEYPLITRVLLVVPFLTAIAGVTAERLSRRAQELGGTVAATAVIGIALALAVGLNVHRSQVAFHRTAVQSPDAVVVQVAQCSNSNVPIIYLLQDNWNSEVVEVAMRIYGHASRFRIHRTEQGPAVSPGLVPPAILVWNAQHPSSELLRLAVLKQYPEARVTDVWMKPDYMGVSVAELGVTGWTPPPRPVLP